MASVAIVLFLAMPPAGEADQPGRTARVGYLGEATPAAYAPLVEGLRQGLRQLDYTEGRNITLEYRWAHGNVERLPALAAELVRLKVDVIVTYGTPATRACQQVTTGIPIVFAGVGAPVELGFADNLSRPGRNVTGLSLNSPELSAKRLALLREAIPKLTRLAVLSNPANPASAPQLKEVESAGRTLGLTLKVMEARVAPDLKQSFAAARMGRSQAVVILGDPMVFANLRHIADLALESRLPTITIYREFSSAGGLMSYGPSLPDLHRRAAAYVQKILKGAKPGDLPVEEPTKFELVINAKTARILGLTIPQSLILQADEVIN